MIPVRIRRFSPTSSRLKKEPAWKRNTTCSIFLDLEHALTRKPEAAFICNPTSLHIPAAIQAARAGCHLFIEKPLSHNLEQVDELISLVESRKPEGGGRLPDAIPSLPAASA